MIQNFTPFFSIILSILLINGLFNLSCKTSNKINIIIKTSNFFFITVVNFFLIVNFLALSIFVYSLFFNVDQKFFQIAAYIIICFGFYKPSYLLKLLFFYKKKTNLFFLICSILFIYFLLSLSPPTDPDSLEYHITAPLYQLLFNDAHFPKYWIHSQLSGSGETLFKYGLSIGALNFSQLLQFFSLFLLIFTILKFDYSQIFRNSGRKLIVCLIILTVPVFLFLVSSSKPQLFPIVTNFIALILVVFYLPNLNNNKLLILFSIIIFLLFASTQMKFSFFLSSGLISIVAIYELYKKKMHLHGIIICFIFFILIILPREVYEYTNLNQNFFTNFLNPTTDPYSATNLNDSLKHGTGNSRFLPYWLFFPISFFSITHTLGLVAFFSLLNFNFKKVLSKKILFISIVHSILSLIFAQPTGRFFIEPFIWLLFVSNFYTGNLKIFKKFIFIYSIIFLIIIGYFSINLFKGNLSHKFHEKVMEKNADGYSLYKWANEVLPNDVIIISTHRSFAFFKNKVITYEFRYLKNSTTNEAFNYYLKNIIEQNPTYIMYSSETLNNENDLLKNCRGDLFAYKKGVDAKAGRSPFARNMRVSDGYIFKLDQKKLKNCKLQLN